MHVLREVVGVDWMEVGSKEGRKARVPKLVVYASLVDDDDCDLLCIPWLAGRMVLTAALLSLGRSFDGL